MKKVFIDPGHGGKDTGATAHGLLEKDIVLAVSLSVKNGWRPSTMACRCCSPDLRMSFLR